MTEPNVEIHDLVHAMLGLMWWPGMSGHDFYLASRLSEAAAAYHYYFLDQAFEPRCLVHEAVVDLGRIWKFNVCPKCNKDHNLYFEIPPTRRATAERVAIECIRVAAEFLDAELQSVAKQAVDGISFVERNPVNQAGIAADALRYGKYTHPLLGHPRLEPYLKAVDEWQLCGSYDEYFHRVANVLSVVNCVDGSAIDTAESISTRRRRALLQDLLLRLGVVLAQSDENVRSLPQAELQLLEDALAQLAVLDPASADSDHLIHNALSTLTRRGEADAEYFLTARAVATLGYDTALALHARSGIESASALAKSPDLTLTAEATCRMLVSALPRVTRWLDTSAVLQPIVRLFCQSPELWLAVEASAPDGRVPTTDKLVERFRLLLSRLASSDQGGFTEAAETALAILAVEQAYHRYQVRARVELDLRDPGIDRYDNDLVVHMSAATQIHMSTVDIIDGSSIRARVAYVFSVTQGRTWLTRTPAAATGVLREFATEPRPLAQLRGGLCQSGIDIVTTETLLAQWLRTGVIVAVLGCTPVARHAAGTQPVNTAAFGATETASPQ